MTVGPDAPYVDFGFEPKSKKIINDFSVGTLVTTGETSAFWTKVLRAASRGKSCAGYSPAAVLAMLQQIEGPFLADPYQFADGREIAGAPAIVSGNPRDDYGRLYQQLPAAELNDASGRGLIGNADLQDVLLAWGESLLAPRLARTLPVSGASASFPTS